MKNIMENNVNYDKNENEDKENKQLNRKKIIFEDKFYNIWNPDITIIDEKENSLINENSNKNLFSNDNYLSDDINNNMNLSIIKNNLSDDLKNNKININKIHKLDKNNIQKIFSEKRIKQIKQKFNSYQSSFIQNNKNNDTTKIKTKNLCAIDIKKMIANKTNFNLNINSYKNKENQNIFKNNLLNFQSFSLNKNQSNINKNLVNIFKNNKKNINLDKNQFSLHRKDLNNDVLKNNKDKEKNSKKENEKIKNITLNNERGGEQRRVYDVLAEGGDEEVAERFAAIRQVERHAVVFLADVCGEKVGTRVVDADEKRVRVRLFDGF